MCGKVSIMGILEYKQEFYLIADLKDIMDTIKKWLIKNRYRIKEEVLGMYIKSMAGHFLGITDRGTKRWLEIHLNHLPTGNFVQIHEKVIEGGFMTGDLIKEEVLALTRFVKSYFPLKSILQELNTKDPSAPEPSESFKFCIYCGGKIPAVALFCEKCGANLE